MIEQKMEAASWAFVRLCTVCAVMQLIAFPLVFAHAQVCVCVHGLVCGNVLPLSR